VLRLLAGGFCGADKRAADLQDLLVHAQLLPVLVRLAVSGDDAVCTSVSAAFAGLAASGAAYAASAAGCR
jgi:hypothetical protein